ncbi:MAG: class C sortase, partial [Fastidiosipila sp.]|nr:class C sortase [Fastidiosipila sp.]
MKNKMNILLLLLVFFLGLAIILYPLVSNFVNSKNQSQAIAAYDSAVASSQGEDYSRLFAAAAAYNRKLRDLPCPWSDYEQIAGYEDLLSLGNCKVMARISIDKIAVDLPVYHGSSEAVLNIGAGHLQGSSLPVGGAGSHAALTAHRGLPSARLFTDLNRLEPGDTFKITVLDRDLTYRIEEISTVAADDLDRLSILPGEDLCTLFTCTPYGINTHRLLVRGKRLPAADLAAASDRQDTADREPGSKVTGSLRPDNSDLVLPLTLI